MEKIPERLLGIAFEPENSDCPGIESVNGIVSAFTDIKKCKDFAWIALFSVTTDASKVFVCGHFCVGDDDFNGGFTLDTHVYFSKDNIPSQFIVLDDFTGKERTVFRSGRFLTTFCVETKKLKILCQVFFFDKRGGWMESKLKKQCAVVVSTVQLEDLLHHSTLFAHLCLYLSPISFWLLLQHSSIFFRKCVKMGYTWQGFFNSRLKQKIAEATCSERTAEIFMRHLNNTACNMHLTGGFLLAVLNGDDAVIHDPQSDLDIVASDCVNSDGGTYPFHVCRIEQPDDATIPVDCCMGTASQILVDLSAEHLLYRHSSTLRFKHTRIDTEMESEYDAIIYLEGVSDICLGQNKKLQVLSLRKAHSVTSYVDGFDFSFCQNTFGMGRLKMWHSKSVVSKTTEPMDLNVMLSNRSELLFAADVCSSMRFCKRLYKRMKKYHQKGYHFKWMYEYFSLYGRRKIYDAHYEKQKQFGFRNLIWSSFLEREHDTKKENAALTKATIVATINHVLTFCHEFFDEKMKKVNGVRSNMYYTW